MRKYIKLLTDKSFMTNALALVSVFIGWLIGNAHLATIGYYALSGAITNWIAIYMLFEKVPYLYGSGVIPNRFEQFKAGINALIMNQFFTEENINRFFLQDILSMDLNLMPIVEHINFEKVYEELVAAILESSLGSMLNMFGGPNALEPMKPNIIKKLQHIFSNFADDPRFKESLVNHLQLATADGVVAKVELIVTQRLNELTPQMVKIIIKQMIHEHLGWLVVWGGIFGGLIGLIVSFISI